jgi:hypothetical protein
MLDICFNALCFCGCCRLRIHLFISSGGGRHNQCRYLLEGWFADMLVRQFVLGNGESQDSYNNKILSQ